MRFMNSRSGLPRLALLLGILWFSLGMPVLAGLPEVQAVLEPEAKVRDFAGCSLACAIGWSLAVSSFLPPEKGNHYDASRLEDGSEKTCWASKGAGEWLEWNFKSARNLEQGIPMRGFRVYNGYGKTPEIWRKNSRVRVLRLELNRTPLLRIHLLDAPGVQRVSFPEILVRPGDKVRVLVQSTFPGSHWTDTCLSEIIPDGAH
jgi:hypothetical protein